MTDKPKTKPRKKRVTKKKETSPVVKPLKGLIQSGSIFIGDTSYFGADPQKYPEGIIEADPTNPFKDWDAFSATHQEDCNIDLPGSFNGDLPGRGIVIQTHMMGGSYSIEKELDPVTGKLRTIKVVLRD